MAKSRTLKIVIDTNLWISFLISKKFNLLDKILIQKKAKLIFSVELLNEIGLTIQKPKLKKYFPANAMTEMLMTFDPYVELVEVKYKTLKSRDPKDNFLLSLAKDSAADFLLTGDKDLLVLKKFGKTKIITISEFLKIVS